jgi:hypothetical protein
MCVTEKIVPQTGRVYTSSACPTAWDLPLLAKYRFGSGRVRPLLEAGPSFRFPTDIGAFGAMVGAGAEFRAGWLRLAPSVRYTRWNSASNLGAPVVTRNELLLVTTFVL